MRTESRVVAFRVLLLSATLYACASTSNDAMNGGPGSGGYISLAGSGSTNEAGGSTNEAGGTTDEAGGTTDEAGGTTDEAGGTTNEAGAASAPVAGSSGEAGGCSGARPSCARKTGNSCSDVFTAADCVNGAWRCAIGAVSSSQCQCVGAPLVCHPGRLGGACTADWVNASCSAGSWTCPANTVKPAACLCVLPGAEAVAGAGGEAATTCP